MRPVILTAQEDALMCAGNLVSAHESNQTTSQIIVVGDDYTPLRRDSSMCETYTQKLTAVYRFSRYVSTNLQLNAA